MSRPRLAPGCRLSDGQDMLLIPEGALRLAGPGREIIQLCDGERTLAEVVSELETRYPDMEPGRIQNEVVAFLDRLVQKRVVDMT